MRLPWNRSEEFKEEIERLKKEKAELEDELESTRKRLEAEERRREELSRKKQEAEEELNRAKDRVESLKSSRQTEEQSSEKVEFRDLSVTEAVELFERLDDMGCEKSVQVFSPGKLSELGDQRALKDRLGDEYSRLNHLESVAVFKHSWLFTAVLKLRPFFQQGWKDSGFDTDEIRDFIDREKTWVLLSEGDTRILRESSGEVVESSRVRSRVDHGHSKGGFSQGRFEKKRKRQVEEHLDSVRERLGDREDVYLLGSRALCEEVPGERLGGFDPNSDPPEQLYSFRVARL